MTDRVRHEQLTNLFLAAQHLYDEERSQFLRRECGDDKALLEELKELLSEEKRSGPLDSTAMAGKAGRPSPLLDVELPAARYEVDQQIGEYQLIRLLGRGAMGQVWEATQGSLNRTVALKLVSPESWSQRNLALFQREARAGGRLGHPGIVTVHAWGQSQGVHWIAQEFVPGGRTLKDLIRESAAAESGGSDYYRMVATLIARVAMALQVAHDAGVIHRDVKPSNILLTPEGAPKIADFGVARVADDLQLSESGDIIGTYSYMSPEQLRGQRDQIDHRSDLFSLGVVIYELLAFQRPFQGDTTHQISSKILMEHPRSPRAIRSQIPVDLSVICGKALEKARRDRYSSMQNFAADLNRFLSHEPILATPPGRVRLARLWTRRHPTISAACLVSSIAFLVISSLAWGLSLERDRLEVRNATVLAQSAELAYGQGKWRQCLELIEQSTQVLGNSTIEQDVLAARCHLALRDYSRARSRLTRRESDRNQGGALRSAEASAQLLLAWLDLGAWYVTPSTTRGSSPVERIHDLLEESLPAADRAIARALVAPRTGDAIHEYQQAILTDPVNYIANISALQLLALSGKDRDAELISRSCARYFPGDHSSAAVNLLVSKARGDEVDARVLSRLEEGFEHELRDALYAAGDYLAAIQNAAFQGARGEEWGGTLGGLTWLETAYEDEGARLHTALRTLSNDSRGHSTQELTPMVHHLGRVGNSLVEFGAVTAARVASGGRALLPEDFEKMRQLLHDATIRHDDGYVRGVREILGWIIDPEVGAPQSGNQRGLTAAKRLMGSAEESSLLRDHVSHSWAFVATMTGQGPGDLPMDPGAAEIANQAVSLRNEATIRLLGSPSLTPVLLRSVNTGTKFLRDPQFMVPVIEAWVGLDSDSTEARLALIKTKVRARQWASAVELCDSLLAQDSSLGEVHTQRKQALSDAREWTSLMSR